jgi:hypothetical protein
VRGTEIDGMYNTRQQRATKLGQAENVVPFR